MLLNKRKKYVFLRYDFWGLDIRLNVVVNLDNDNKVNSILVYPPPNYRSAVILKNRLRQNAMEQFDTQSSGPIGFPFSSKRDACFHSV